MHWLLGLFCCMHWLLGLRACVCNLLGRRAYVCNLLDDRVYAVWMRGDNAAAKELWQQGGAEALRGSLDETYHPDEVSGHSSTLIHSPLAARRSSSMTMPVCCRFVPLSERTWQLKRAFWRCIACYALPPVVFSSLLLDVFFFVYVVLVL